MTLLISMHLPCSSLQWVTIFPEETNAVRLPLVPFIINSSTSLRTFRTESRHQVRDINQTSDAIEYRQFGSLPPTQKPCFFANMPLHHHILRRVVPGFTAKHPSFFFVAPCYDAAWILCASIPWQLLNHGSYPSPRVRLPTLITVLGHTVSGVLR